MNAPSPFVPLYYSSKKSLLCTPEMDKIRFRDVNGKIVSEWDLPQKSTVIGVSNRYIMVRQDKNFFVYDWERNLIFQYVYPNDCPYAEGCIHKDR
jgi:hypothetical protein